MKLRKVFALLIALAMCLSFFTACGSTSDEAEAAPAAESAAPAEEAASVEEAVTSAVDAVEETVSTIAPKNGDHYVIAYSCIAYAIAPYPTLVGDCLQEAIEGMGWEFNSLAAEGDVELQAEQVETLLSADPDMLVLWAGDASLAPIYCSAAQEAGIPVLLIMCSIPEENRDMTIGYIGSDMYVVGYIEGQAMVERYGAENEALIVSVSGVESQQDYQDKLAGFKAALIEAGCLNEDGSSATWAFVGPEWCLSSRDTAQTAMENYIQTYGDSITAVIGFDDDLSMGCVNAIQAANLGDSIEVWSQMGMIEMINAIRNGQAYYTIYLPAYANANAVVDSIVNYMATGSVGDEWMIQTDFIEITPENCYDYDGDF